MIRYRTSICRQSDGASPVRHRVRDVNKDGLGDLLLQFNVRDTGISCGETEAELAAETFAAGHFSEADLIRTVGCDLTRLGGRSR